MTGVEGNKILSKVILISVFLSSCATTLEALTQGPLCLECEREAVPTSCNKVVRCGPHEKCMVRQFENKMGAVLYQSGCFDSRRCPTNHSDSIGRSVKGLKTRDITMCRECCHGDYCNSGGCGQTGFHEMQNVPPVCYSCPYVDRPEDCHHIERCETGQTCFIEEIGQTHYIMGCTSNQNCQQIKYNGLCSACCSGDFCNRQCNSSVAGQHQHTAATHNFHTSTTAEQQNPTTSSGVTPKAPILRCFHCLGSNTSECHSVQTCPPDYACYSSSIPLPNKQIRYDFNCEHKSKCPQHEQQNVWVGIGRRKVQSNTGSTFSYCCYTPECNYVAPTVTQLHTTVVTSIKPSILDVGPLNRNVTVNTTVTLSCHATGMPQPVIHWNVPLHNTHPSNYFTSGPELVIFHISPVNDGYYTCIAANNHGIDSQTLKLNVVP